ncbi:MAG: cytochrome c3 family protein [Coriobacteriia bacterium]|nr:cytochrome c3 family protein [Coriobacteriia bacterium]
MSEQELPKTEQAENAAPAEKSTKKPKTKKKLGIVVAVIVVVVAVAGVGFWKWHETPEFCAAICHFQDPYLEGYQQEQNTAGVDKYGNQVSNTNAMMSTLHRTTQTQVWTTIACMDCHHPVIAQQISEGITWVSGNYYDPLTEKTTADLTHWEGTVEDAFCANANCHAYLVGEDGMVDRDKLEKTTWSLDFNPHSTHHEGIQPSCTECHKGHRASVNMCTACHDEATLPAGWISYQESADLMSKVF